MEITEENFSNYFFDVRKNRPKKGQIIAKFSAIAAFGEGLEKKDLLNILKMNKAKEAAQVMNRIHCAKEPDCYKVCREMCEDLLAGMSEEEIIKKEYEYNLEILYYTNRECVPSDNKHWEVIPVISYDEENETIKCDIVI